jgi:hypothetical protein
MHTTFSWTPTYRPSADPQVIGEELERIRERDGGITVDVMLEEARPEDAPLHPCCTWDDFAAAENWRKDELRRVVRSLKVVTSQQEEYRAFVHCANPVSTEQGYYQRTEVAVQNLDEYELVFKSAAARLGEAQRALSELKRVADSVQIHQSVRRSAVAKADQALIQAGKELAKAA